MMNTNIPLDKELVACCGLYCGACRKYLIGKCPGCRENEKAPWCEIRVCCKENSFSTCADCSQPVMQCRKFNTFISRVFAFITHSDREGCINRIRETGMASFAQEMCDNQQMTLKKKKKTKR